MKKQYTCTLCGGIYKKYPSKKRERATKHFCSEDHYLLYRKITMKVMVPCHDCEQDFWINKSHYRNQKIYRCKSCIIINNLMRKREKEEMKIGIKTCTKCGIKYKGTKQSSVCNTCSKHIRSIKYDMEISSQLKRNKTRITKWYHTNEYVNYTRGDLLDILNRHSNPTNRSKVTCCFSSLKMLKVLSFVVINNKIYDDETFLNAIELLSELKGCIIGRNRLVILAGIIYWDKRNKFSQREVGNTFFISDVSIRNMKPLLIQFGLVPYMR